MAIPLPPIRSGPTYYDYYARELLINTQKYNNLEEELQDDVEETIQGPG